MDPFWSSAWFLPLVIGAAVLLAVVVALLAAKALVHVCRPNEVLVFAGRTHRARDGGPVGFRVVAGGRAFRIPLLERMERMDVSLLSVSMTVSGAYSLGGIPLTVQAVANVKVSSEPEVLGNALERFLGHGRATITEVARETLEGHLRGVLATMTPEQVNEDRLTFADRLAEEAGEDLRQLGLQLDTLKIQHVSDERRYLDSIGRVRIAEVLREAEVAESDAVRAAEESEAAAHARARVAEAQAEARIQQHHHALAEQRAGLEARARSEEERALAAAEEARAEAEKALQKVRAELEELRLRADVIVPAEARRRARELEAAGDAAPVAENGRATAESLALVSEAWRDAGGHALEMFVLQHLEELLGTVAGAASRVRVDTVSLLDSGDGATLAGYLRAYPAAVAELLREVSSTLGVDIPAVLGGPPREAPRPPAKDGSGQDAGEEAWS
ncbi:flotillin family protein [Archangium lipolyticum]|uniref:flotillin family protein n=1 Tax=Archangium lipolyticum TaxID=2970465 RepID=UPI00214A8233|nr:flotillin family protein [Archangium lipolyticum]